MAYSKKDNYPSLKTPGVYPSGSIKELGLDSDNLEKFSLGNWNPISKSNRRFFVSFQGQPLFIEALYENGEYLGRPVKVKLINNDPVLTWTLLKRNGGFTTSPNQTGDSGIIGQIGDTINGGYAAEIDEMDYDGSAVNHIPSQQWYSPSATWYATPNPTSTTARVGPLMPLSRFLDNYESDDVKKMFKFYRTLHHTYKRNDEEMHHETEMIQNEVDGPDDYSLEVREIIVDIFEEKYTQLKDLIESTTGYLKELDPDDYSLPPPLLTDDFDIPIKLTFNNVVQSQIDEILSFNIEVYGDGRGVYHSAGAGLVYPGKSVRELDTTRMPGHWYHRFKLYFGAYAFNNDNQTTKGYSTIDDVGREVGVIWNSPTFDVTEDYLPEDSYVLSGEQPIEYWGGIYFEKLTDDNSIIKLGDSGEYGFSSPKTGFTNTGRTDDSDRFYFGLSYDALFGFMGTFSGTLYGLESGENGRTVLEDRLISIGHPYYPFDYIEDIGYGGETEDYAEDVLEPLDYEVRLTTSGSTGIPDMNFLYYDTENEYNQTSYPIKTKLVMGLLDFDYLETPINLGNYSLLDEIYLGEYNPLETGNSDPEEGIYRYLVLQWGDEKNLLTDEMILNSEYFFLYTSEEVPTPDTFHYKRVINNKPSQLSFTIDSFHVYNTPGPKAVKIIVYRYDSTGNVLLQTTLVTKNIAINDGTLLSQDFSIFGGTNFNFLPLRNNQAIIGGFNEDSKYNNSVEKIVKDDDFIQDDYLERVSSKDFLKNFNNGLFGESPGQLDLGISRVFKGTKDIYDFITDNKQSIVDDQFNLPSGQTKKLPSNSFATDIFIDDENCVIDLNPQDTEFLSITNIRGTVDKAIIVGDYQINQPEDGAIHRAGVMQLPLLEKNQDKQAF